MGLRRISTGTRYLAVGSLIAGGVLTAAVAKALPGRSSSPATTNPPAAGQAAARHVRGRWEFGDHRPLLPPLLSLRPRLPRP